MSGRFGAKVLAGAASGYIVVILLGHPTDGKFAALLGTAFVVLSLLLIPIFHTWYQTVKVKAWARGEVAKNRAIERVRIEVGRAKQSQRVKSLGWRPRSIHVRRKHSLMKLQSE